MKTKRWFQARFVRDPWFNLGFHIDHRKPYAALHFPGFRLEIGWTGGAVSYSKDVAEGVWLLSLEPVPAGRLAAVRAFWSDDAPEERGGQ